MNISTRHILFWSFCFFSMIVESTAQTAPVFWKDLGNETTLRSGQEPDIRTRKARYLQVDQAILQRHLDQSGQNGALQLLLPDPEGTTKRFVVYPVASMMPGLQERFPQLRTYAGYQIQDKRYRIRLDINAHSWHAMVSNGAETYFLDPVLRPADDLYQAYYKVDCLEDQPMECTARPARNRLLLPRTDLIPIEEELRTYRLAVTASYSYTKFHGETVEGALAAILTTVNRINMVYERDMGIRLILVDNNDRLIITTPNDDPFVTSGREGNANQAFIDDKIGESSYDIGHVFSTSSFGNGYAWPLSVCLPGYKAQAYTALPRPQGDPFDIDYVAHELGHQFGANHSFNGVDQACNGSRWPDTAFEPGGGTTIMSYAGLCGRDNIQSKSNDYFHGGNIEEVAYFTILDNGNTCATLLPTNNQAPDLQLPEGNWVIPSNTPFVLSAQATDPEGDALTYSWEQVDHGGAAPLGEYGSGNSALFRSFPPSDSPVRTFPSLEDLLNNLANPAELLPNTNREMNFQLTVRDNHLGGGAVARKRIHFEVTKNAGPFRVIAPDNWTAGNYQLLEWEVAGTNLPPVSTEFVEIALSLDGGYSYPVILQEQAPNDGQAVVYLPRQLADRSVRIRIRAVDNIYFALSEKEIKVGPTPEQALTVLADPPFNRYCAGDTIEFPVFVSSLGLLEEDSIRLEINAGAFQRQFRKTVQPGLDTILLQLFGSELFSSGVYTVQFRVQSRDLEQTGTFSFSLYSREQPFEIELTGPMANDPAQPLQPTFNWRAGLAADFYQVELSRDANFDSLLFVGQVTNGREWTYPQVLPEETEYFWRVRGVSAQCESVEVSAIQSFTTEAIRCAEFSAEDIPVDFDPLPFIQSHITIEDDLLIRDIDLLDVAGIFSQPGNLSFRLRSPEGPVLEVLGKRTSCTEGERFHFSLDDEALITEVPCPNDRDTTFRPQRPLSTFDGQNARGRWTLSIFDNGDLGQLTSWKLRICFGASSVTSTNNPITEEEQLLVYPNPSTDQFQLQLLNSGIQQIQIADLSGRLFRQISLQGQKNYQLDASGWASGMYFCMAMDVNGQIYVQKLVKR